MRPFAHLLLLLGALFARASPVRAMPGGDDDATLVHAAELIDALRVEDAAAILEPLAARHPGDPDVRFELGHLRLMRGEYAAARDDLEATLVRAVGVRHPEERAMLAEVAHETEAVTHGFVELRSEDGRYRILHAPGTDRFVAHDALAILRAVDEGLIAELGVRHPGPLRLEILPTASALSRVSSLSVEDIERTGTIALCKWDRLMITSPRALAHGYPWADTIGHEAVHLVLSRATEDQAPVWMQEGYARFLERRWRGGPPTMHLDPGSQALLVERATNDTLIPFERLHPSIAMLPSAEDAALAFAQVSTFVASFYEAHGAEGLRDVAHRVRQGQDARQAFAEAAGEPFDSLEGRWRDSVARLVAPADAPPVPHLSLRHGDAEPDDSEEVSAEDARRFVRLGDLLWTSQRYLAASMEYGQAHEAAPRDPIVASRLGRSAVQAGDGQRAIDALAPLREMSGEYEPLLSNLASAYALVGDTARARDAAVEATRVNPFDPEPHCTLSTVGTDDEADLAFQAEACAALGGRPE
jgi:Flp pilus assembly protein TadD